MAFDPIFKMSLQAEDGKYYFATQSLEGVWTVDKQDDLRYLENLPEGWEETEVTWERDLSYLGIYRSKTNSNYTFSQDARAIIQSIRSAKGIRGYGLLTIYMINYDAAGISYPVFYASELDFKGYRDFMQTGKLEIPTLDSGLIRDLHAYGDTKYNIPIWTTPDSGATWETDANWIYHDGIKLVYRADYISAASTLDYPRNLLYYTVSPTPYSPGAQQLSGWNDGAIGDGYHIVVGTSQLTIVQNNGTPTAIGNDILQPFLLQGNQTPGAANFASESSFFDANHSQPYTKNNYSLKDLLHNDTNSVEMWVSCKGAFDKGGSGLLNPSISMGGSTTTGRYLAFVIFEIDSTNNPPIDPATSRYVTPGNIDPNTGNPAGAIILKIPLPDSTGTPYAPYGPEGKFDTTDTPVSVILNFNKVYVFGIIHDVDHPASAGSAIYASFTLSDLQFSIRSKYDSGASGVPIPAPSFPPSFFAGFRLHQLLEKLVKNLPTKNSDGYGFPIPVTTTYHGVSNYLSDDSAIPAGDGIPYQNMITSAYCIHDLAGQSYITMSLNELFDYCKKVWGCGMGKEGDTLRIENLKYFFDNTTMILDLGYDVTGLEIMQGGEQLGLGANLKLGYSKADTNTDFGMTPYNTELFFNTPASAVPGVMDFQETSIMTEMYALEKIRQQQVSQPVGVAYDPASPSSDNQACSFYVMPSVDTTLDILKAYDPGNPTNPGGTEHLIQVYRLTMRNGQPTQLPAAQSTDPTAATAPYIQGQQFPDTCINMELSPGRFLTRDTGAFIHSVLDNMDSESLTFRNTYVMQFNNTVEPLAGTQSNLSVGTSSPVITEMQDVSIGSLPSQLFKPIPIRVTSKYPVNMYSILNSNPNGYVRFFWDEPNYGTKEYKFFLTKATQSGATGMATTFEGWLTPDMVI